jgi:regulator of replication initiation timing
MWHEPGRPGAGVWLCNNCGYNPAQPEAYAKIAAKHAQAVPSHDNEQPERIVPSHADELKSHFDDGLKRLVEDILRQLRPTHEQLLKIVEESRAEVATLAATVAEMRDTIKSLTAENGGLRNQLQTAREELGALARASTPTPPARAPSKRKRTESQSPHQQPTKQVRHTSPTPTLMHSKHAGPSVTTVPVQPPPTTADPPRGDTEEGWKKVERRKGKAKGKREKKVGARPTGGVPTWADIARGGGVSVNVFLGGGAGYTKPKARRPGGKGKKKQQGQQRPASSSVAG